MGYLWVVLLPVCFLIILCTGNMLYVLFGNQTLSDEIKSD